MLNFFNNNRTFVSLLCVIFVLVYSVLRINQQDFNFKRRKEIDILTYDLVLSNARYITTKFQRSLLIKISSPSLFGIKTGYCSSLLIIVILSILPVLFWLFVGDTSLDTNLDGKNDHLSCCGDVVNLRREIEDLGDILTYYYFLIASFGAFRTKTHHRQLWLLLILCITFANIHKTFNDLKALKMNISKKVER